MSSPNPSQDVDSAPVGPATPAADSAVPARAASAAGQREGPDRAADYFPKSYGANPPRGSAFDAMTSDGLRWRTLTRVGRLEPDLLVGRVDFGPSADIDMLMRRRAIIRVVGDGIEVPHQEIIVPRPAPRMPLALQSPVDQASPFAPASGPSGGFGSLRVS